jgi:site-specific DNA recombinase
VESRALTGLRAHNDAGNRRRRRARLYAANQSTQPPALKLIGIHPPRACRSRETIAEIVRVIDQGGWHRALSDRLTELEAKQNSRTTHRADAIA